MRPSRRLGESFSYAFDGAGYVWRTQRNVRIHALMGYLAITSSWILGVERLERLLITLVVVIVLVVELLNTSIEAAVDIHVTGYHPLAKTAKNVAAGAVLVAAALSVVVGIEVFGPKLATFIPCLVSFSLQFPRVFLLWMAGFIVLTVEVIRPRRGAR